MPAAHVAWQPKATCHHAFASLPVQAWLCGNQELQVALTWTNFVLLDAADTCKVSVEPESFTCCNPWTEACKNMTLTEGLQRCCGKSELTVSVVGSACVPASAPCS